MSKKDVLLNLNREQNFDNKKKDTLKIPLESSLKEPECKEYLKEISPNSNVVKVCGDNSKKNIKKIKNNEPLIIKEYKEKGKSEEKTEEKIEENNKIIIENPNSNQNLINEITDLKNNQNKYCDQIKNLENKIKEMNDDYKIEIKKYKTEIENKEKDIQKLVTANNNLKNSLEILTTRLDKLLLNANAQKKNNKNNNNNNNIISKKEQELQHKLEIKEKELKNQQQLISILTRDNKNVREKLDKLGLYNKDVDLSKIIHELYQKNMSLELKMKEYKDGLTTNKNSLSFKKNTKSRNYINNYNSMNYSYIGNNNNFGQITNKFTFKTNSFQKMHNIKYNTDKKRSISIENYRSRGSSGKKYLKKFRLKGNKEKNTKNELDVFLEKSDLVERFKGNDTIESLERLFEEDNNFFRKLVSYEKIINSKKNEMESTLRHFENELKKNKENLKKEQYLLKRKEKEIKDLNKEKDILKVEKANLESACINLYNNYTSLSQEYQLIDKKNEENKNSIFSIEGLIEATSKDGKKIPLTKKNTKKKNINDNNTNNNNELISSPQISSSNDDKNQNDSVSEKDSCAE